MGRSFGEKGLKHGERQQAPENAPPPGLARHACLSLCRFSAKIMAKGEIEESRWEEPSVMYHLQHLYQLAPNTVVLTNAREVILIQFWPGATPGESTCTVSLYLHKPMETEKE